MHICVMGLWHLGTVTAACLAARGHDVTGLDFNADSVGQLQQGHPPLFEPGLEALLAEGIQAGRLRFTSSAEAVSEADVVWVCYDTPVDDGDHADTEWVIQQIGKIFPYLADHIAVLISSQLPVGTTAQLEQAYRIAYPATHLSFAYSPENLRLGNAIRVFTQPDRVVVGVRKDADSAAHSRLADLLGSIAEHIEWMSVESAEMTKHALNAFLATSVTFINEIATLCEQVGADASEVERGLKTESRIGPRAYLKPGGAFAGGTLARDVMFLKEIGARYDLPMSLLSGVKASNEGHKRWAYRRLMDLLAPLSGKIVAVLGLTYKPGTDTLRRSAAVELCQCLHVEGAHVQAHDCAVETLPDALAAWIELGGSPGEVLRGADAAVIATEWPDYRSLAADLFASQMRTPIVLDANRFLAATLQRDFRIRYYAVGK